MLTVAALFCSSSLLCIWNSEQQRMKLDGQWVLTVMMSPLARCHQYSSVVTAIIPYSRTVTLQYTLLGDYWECVRPARLPVLTWVPSYVPPGNNIQDTFLIESATDTTRVPSTPDMFWVRWQTWPCMLKVGHRTDILASYKLSCLKTLAKMRP